MGRLKAIILSALAVGIIGTVGAQNLDMSGARGSHTFDQPGKPTRGMTQARVRANFGEPNTTVAAVGDPPISRWVYPEFVVFFEYDKVIHSVTIR